MPSSSALLRSRQPDWACSCATCASHIGVVLRDIALLPELRSELEDIEAGRLRPDAALVEALLGCYDADLDQLVPLREPAGGHRRHRRRAAGQIPDRRPRAGEAAASTRTSGKPTSRPWPRCSEPTQETSSAGLRSHAIDERISPLSTDRLRVLVHKLPMSIRSTRVRGPCATRGTEGSAGGHRGRSAPSRRSHPRTRF